MNAWLHELHKVLGLFIPLIVTNCAILGRAEAFASRQKVLPSMVDGFFMGIGFTAVLVIIGGIREVLGSGTLVFQRLPCCWAIISPFWKWLYCQTIRAFCC